MWLGDVRIGFVGELHPRWKQSFELTQTAVLFELDWNAVLQRPVPVFQSVAKLQPVQRDIAVVVADEVSHDALMSAIHAAPTNGLLRNAQLFDIYRPKTDGTTSTERSLAVRVTLGSDEATLTEEQIEAAMQAIVVQLQTQVGARQRG